MAVLNDVLSNQEKYIRVVAFDATVLLKFFRLQTSYILPTFLSGMHMLE